MSDLKLSEEQRLRLLASAADARATSAEYQLKSERFNREFERVDKKGKLRQKLESVNEAQVAAVQADTKLRAVVKEIEEALGTSLDGYQIDPESGELKKRCEAATAETSSSGPDPQPAAPPPGVG